MSKQFSKNLNGKYILYLKSKLKTIAHVQIKRNTAEFKIKMTIMFSSKVLVQANFYH